MATTGDLQEKTSTGWVTRGNLKGPAGKDGANGTGGGSSPYTLPVASALALGGVKSAGAGLVGNVVVNADGSMSAPSGGGGSASFPAQSAATNGQYLQSTGVAGAEAWAGMKIGYVLRFLNADMQEPLRFFRATTLYRMEVDAGIATLSYAINGAASTPVPLVSNVWTGSLQIPAKASVVWSITYNTNYNEGNVELLGYELSTP
ncbi:hypothetical protein GKZ68_10475 [Hymenobacter sp. BRD128]|uniref:hypothetical protein n=1 Tax=Hymenobacter sp. BRD128 TaxID=2675878 RepID=UPI0015634B74|nr:hypothetical protein [Hymenobacter sp. BRD128]QKG57014.1 hypothetical protein GKZ68_10475 [Hymenobacter sp. BRD128]